MMGRITDYGWFNWCETCDHGYLVEDYDTGFNMCVSCAREIDGGKDD